MAGSFDNLARLHRMDERTWQRHANPWSVWTRVPIGPLLVLAVYARLWIGWWCLLAVALLVLWAWVNPRAFPPPQLLESWAARGVMGERLFLDRRAVPIPAHHLRAAQVLIALSLCGLPPTVYGLIVFDPWATAFGASLLFLGKLWFVDRMVWLHDEAAGLGTKR
jgi:hypothetical protein